MKYLARIIAYTLIAVAMTACVKDTPKPESPETPADEQVTATQSAYSAGAAQKPRYMVCHDGMVYITCGYPPAILRIDTASGEINRILKFNTNYDLEGVAIVGSKLFAASSWAYDNASNIVYDSRVFVVDINTFNLTDVISVPADPQRIKALDGSHVLVSCGNGYNVPTTSVLIDAATHAVTELGREMTAFDVNSGLAYTYSGGYGTPATFYLLDPLANTTENILDGCDINHPYSINCIGSRLYVTTQDIYGGAGDVVCFNTDGTQQWRCEAGMLPSKVADLGDSTAYVLNEGNWGNNEASLSRVNLSTGDITNNIFGTANGRGLGDVAQDLVVYGTKAYVTVSFSNTIEVVNISDNKSRQIQL